MNTRIELIKQWILKRNKIEITILFFLSLLFIYFVFNFIFLSPTITKNQTLQNQIKELRAQRATIQQQTEMITQIIRSPEFSGLLSQQQQIKQKAKQVQKKIEFFTPIFISEIDFSKLTKDVIGQLDNTIVLVNLKKFPLQRWVVPEIDKENVLIQNIYQHKLSIEFRGDFFSILAYLTRLEKLPWHLYWDSLEYKVTKYPEANVMVQLYVLSNEKSV